MCTFVMGSKPQLGRTCRSGPCYGAAVEKDEAYWAAIRRKVAAMGPPSEAHAQAFAAGCVWVERDSVDLGSADGHGDGADQG